MARAVGRATKMNNSSAMFFVFLIFAVFSLALRKGIMNVSHSERAFIPAVDRLVAGGRNVLLLHAYDYDEPTF